MARKYRPTIIQASHAATARVEEIRNAMTPPPPEPPAAWEAPPEPTPAPQSRAGRGKRIVVERRVERVVERVPKGLVALNSQDAADLKMALMYQEAHSTGMAREAAVRARRALGRARKEGS